MSTFTLTGFFSLTSGQRVHTELPKPNSSTQGVYYVHYVTSLNTAQTGAISAEIRKYSPPHDIILQNDTIVFVVAKAYVPPGDTTGNMLLEASHIIPVPGNPNSEGYEDLVPDFCFPLIFAQGTVTGEHTETERGDCNISSNGFGLHSWCNEIVDLVVCHRFFLLYIHLTATSLFYSVQMAHGQKDTEMEKCAFSESKRPVNIDRNMLRNKF